MWGPVKMTKFLDVQNVYLNDSVVTYFYGFDYTQRAAFRSLPIMPTGDSILLASLAPLKGGPYDRWK